MRYLGNNLAILATTVALPLCFAASAFGQLNLPSTVPVPWGPNETLFPRWTHTSPGTSDLLRIAFSTTATPDTPASVVQEKIWYQVSNDNGASYDTIRPLIQDGAGYDQRHPIEPVYIEPDFLNPRQNSFIMSASIPITMSNGQILVPFNFWPYDENDDHKLAYVDEPISSYHNSGVLIGTWEPDRSDIKWDLGVAPSLDFDTQSTRGQIEPSVAELQQPGNIVMSMRGSNQSNFNLPSHAWKSVSNDFGQTWSQTDELTYSDGSSFFSPSAMSTFLRNENNQRLYWFGNIIPGNANGNSPRYPLVIAEVDEQSLGLIQSTVQVIADIQPGDLSTIQYSNFEISENPSTGVFTVDVPKVGNGESGWDHFQVTPPIFDKGNGDFNNNGAVDAADYTVWRDNFGSSTGLPHDNGLAGPIGQPHYDLWVANFGAGPTEPVDPVVPVTDNLLIQLDGTDISATGSLVDSWNDQASRGGAEDFSQTGAARPSLLTGVTFPNGTIRDVVEFDGSETLRLGPDADLDNQGKQSWYMVVRYDDPDGNTDQGAYGANYSASPTKLTTGLSSGNAGHILRNAGSAQDVNAGTTPYNPDGGEWILISGRWNMTDELIPGFGPERDTISVYDSSGNLVSSGTRQNVDGLPGLHIQSILGNRGDSHGARFMEGAIAEFLVYDDILSSTDHFAVQDYLRSKYFLGGSASFAEGNSVPEPTSVVLLGLVALTMLRNRRRTDKKAIL